MLTRRVLGAAAIGLAALFLLSAQESGPPPPVTANQPLLSAQDLDNLVAPIALYSDPLLGEALAAATYPAEVSEAAEWVQKHKDWKPSKLMDEAKKQKWDPSVQGLVAFPQALNFLSQNISWTTSLGNAFLAQQSDVMDAVQRMRSQAQTKGKLQTTSQETVTTTNEQGKPAIVIQPADPDVWYVPVYNPAYIWGPPIYGYYPPLFYPGIGVGIGFGWSPGIYLGLYFGGWGGWGWGGWGWMPNWYGGTIVLNHSFFHRYGFSHFHGAPLGNSAWAHDPGHRLGVPYANRTVAARYGGAAARTGGAALQGRPAGNERFGSQGFEQRGYTNNHSVFGGYHDGGSTRIQSDHGFSSMGGGRAMGGGGFNGGGARGGGGGGRR